MALTPEQINFEKNIRSAVLTRFPLLGVSLSDAKFIPDDRVGTAMTEGKNVYYSPTFFKDKTFEEQEFLIEHELLHKQFRHITRSKDKDMGTWNLATDAVVNQILKESGHNIPAGMIDYPQALNKSADEVYDAIIEELKNNPPEQEQPQQPQSNNSKQNNKKMPQWLQKLLEKFMNPSQSGQGNNSSQATTNPPKNAQPSNEMPKNFTPPDMSDIIPPESAQTRQGQTGQGNEQQDELPDNFTPPTPPRLPPSMQNQIANQQHSGWQQSVPKMEQLEKKQRIKDVFRKDKQSEITEENFQAKNAEKKESGFEELKKKLEKKKLKKSLGEAIKEKLSDMANQQKIRNCESLEELNNTEVEDNYEPIVDWKKYLNKPKKKEDEQVKKYRWSQRRADADNYYMSRLERFKETKKKDVDDKPITLVSIDTSPSISESLLRGFINQLAPLTEESRVFVSFFWEHSTPFREVKPENNGNIHISVSRGYGTNLDAAVRVFKHFELSTFYDKGKKIKPEVLNRIIFTDGDGQQFPDYDLYDTDCLWLVFDYPHGKFYPRCGKALQFSSRDLMRDIKREERERKRNSLNNQEEERNFLK